jgi:hypothetical protein
MDPETVDQQYASLQQQGQHTAQLVAALAAKLQAAAAGGDPNAREWQLDLKELALAVREEEDQTGNLLTAIHTMVDNHVQSAPAYQAPPQQGYQPGYQQPAAGFGGAGGGMLQRFLGGGFGRAVVTGAGFGIGDDIINHIL